MPPSKRGQNNGIDELQVENGDEGEGKVKAMQCCWVLGSGMIRENSCCRILIRVLNLVP
jgi:hypothetical protein